MLKFVVIRVNGARAEFWLQFLGGFCHGVKNLDEAVSSARAGHKPCHRQDVVALGHDGNGAEGRYIGEIHCSQ